MLSNYVHVSDTNRPGSVVDRDFDEYKRLVARQESKKLLTDREVTLLFSYLHKQQSMIINGYNMARYPFFGALFFAAFLFVTSYITSRHFCFYYFDVTYVQDHLYILSVVLSAACFSSELSSFFRLVNRKTGVIFANFLSIVSTVALFGFSYWVAVLTV